MNDLVEEYREMRRTMTQSVPWEKVEDLRRGALFMSVPNNDHFAYVSKFLQPVLHELPIPDVVGIACLSVLMEREGTKFRVVTYWPILKVWKSVNGEDWFFKFGKEIKGD